MGYTIEVVEKDKYVRLVLEGEMPLTDLEAARAEANLALQANNWLRLLIDAARTVSSLSTTDNFEFTVDHQIKFPPVFAMPSFIPRKSMRCFVLSRTWPKTAGFLCSYFQIANGL